MTRKDTIQCCLRCKYFRLKSVEGGVCRNEKDASGKYPQKANSDMCSFWQDCGQNYFIRQGWMKSQNNQEKQPEK